MSPQRAPVPFMIKDTSTRVNSHVKVRYNPYTKTYLPLQPPKTSESYHRHIKFSSNVKEDDLWIGDEMMPIPHERATRFWFQNCHGLLNARDVTKFHYEMHTYIEQNIHYVSFAETNINSSHMFSKYQIENSFKHITDHGRIDINNSPGFAPDSSYQPGGVAAGFHGRICNRFSKTTKDPGGRWIAHEFVGKTTTLKVYTLYRVNHKSQRGDITAWQQQKRYLQERQCDNNPRKQVIDDLIESITRDQENGAHIILFGDLNEQITSRERTNTRFQAIGLVNILQHSLEKNTLPRTHKLGSGAIDHMWLSGGILNSVYRAGMAPFDFIGSTDHRGLYCDLFLDEILDSSIIPLQSLPHRRLKSSIPKRVNKYLKLVKSQWEIQNIDARFDIIINDHESMSKLTLEEKLNNLDDSITNLLRHAEKNCSKVPKMCNFYWSPKLKRALQNPHKSRNLRNKATYVQPGASLPDTIVLKRVNMTKHIIHTGRCEERTLNYVLSI